MSGIRSLFRIERANERARMSFREFAEQTVLRSLPKRVPARHQDVLCDYIQRLADGPGDEILLVSLPPGGAKSMFCSRALPAWILGNHPKARILMLTNTAPLAEVSGKAVREILTSKTYQHIFDGLTVSASSSAASAFDTTAGGQFYGVGVWGTYMGRRSEYIIVDDPVSGFEEASSETQLEKLWTTFKESALSRAVPGARIIVVCQRLARRDLVGCIKDHFAAFPDGRRVIELKLPMLCTDPDNDPLGRELGEPLWPEYWTKGMLVDAQADTRIWKTLYQQQPPSDDGSFASPDDIPTADRPTVSNAHRVYIGCDVAQTENGGDYTVFAVLAFEKNTGRMHLVDMYRQQVEQATGCERLLDLIERWRPEWAGIENDPISKGFMSHLRTRARTRNVNINMLEETKFSSASGERGKEARAGALRSKIKSNLLCLDRTAPWFDVVMGELLKFPHAGSTGHDDIVDALAIVARKTTRMLVEKVATEDSINHDGFHLNGLFEDRERHMGSRARL